MSILLHTTSGFNDEVSEKEMIYGVEIGWQAWCVFESLSSPGGTVVTLLSHTPFISPSFSLSLPSAHNSQKRHIYSKSSTPELKHYSHRHCVQTGGRLWGFISSVVPTVSRLYTEITKIYCKLGWLLIFLLQISKWTSFECFLMSKIHVLTLAKTEIPIAVY